MGTSVSNKNAVDGYTSFAYYYDNHGNILSKSEYYSPNTGTEEEPLRTITYTYGDSVWKDRLTGYKGGTITYDEIGNPVRYYDGRTFAWEQGRQLKASTLADGTRVSYQYNSDGIRTQKTVGSTTTTYLVDDSGTIQALKEGNETLIFMYDSTGRREGFIWYTGTVKNGAYYYLYNGQGDVIGILASDLTPVVSYEYDSWGKLLSTSGTQASTVGRLNPFRYRGYCYDEETGFYYLKSRYYDSEVGRFISADTTDILGVSSDLYDKNLYAYCDNNPVIRIDYDGEAWQFALAGGGTLAAGGMVKIGTVAALKSIGGTILAGLSVVTPAGWLAIGTVVVIGGVVYLKGKTKSKDKSKERVQSPIGRRNDYNSRKKAKEAAKKAGGGKDPIHHPKGCHGNKNPHYHPNVKNNYRSTPHGVSSHDHYYYPR